MCVVCVCSGKLNIEFFKKLLGLLNHAVWFLVLYLRYNLVVEIIVHVLPKHTNLVRENQKVKQFNVNRKKKRNRR